MPRSSISASSRRWSLSESELIPSPCKEETLEREEDRGVGKTEGVMCGVNFRDFVGAFESEDDEEEDDESEEEDEE